MLDTLSCARELEDDDGCLMSEHDWRFFLSEWEDYKRATGVTDQHIFLHVFGTVFVFHTICIYMVELKCSDWSPSAASGVVLAFIGQVPG